MMLSDCDTYLRELGHAFRVAKMEDQTVTAYYEAFKRLEARQFATLVDWGKQNCDRFPTIKELWRGMYELNMVERPRMSDMDKDTFVVVCTCNWSFAVGRHAQIPIVKCPNPECHISYDMPYIMHNADQYNVLWADPDTRAALRTRISPKDVLKQVADLVSRMAADKKTAIHAQGISERMRPRP